MPQPPDLDANGQPVGTKPPDLDAHGQPVSGDHYQGPDTYWGGVLHSLGDTVSRTGKAVLQGVGDTVDPRTYLHAAQAKDAAEQRMVDEVTGKAQPSHDYGIGQLQATGRLLTTPEGGGRAIGGLASGLVLPKVLDAVRGPAPLVVDRYMPNASSTPQPGIPMEPPPAPLPQTLNGIPIADLKAAGVGEESMRLMREGRPTPQPMTRGSLAMKPQQAPEPVSTPTPIAQRPDLVPVGSEGAYNATRPTEASNLRMMPQTPKEQVLSDLVRRPDIVQEAKAMQARAANAKYPATAAADRPSYLDFNKFTPDEFHSEEWSSGAEPGSADAKSMAATHRYEAEIRDRLKYLLDSSNGMISQKLLREAPLRGIPMAATELLAHHLGAPPFVGMALGSATPEIAAGAMRLGRAAYQAPESSAALRAAILSRLQNAGSTNQGSTLR